ncbi:carboxylating nicotinate-nucleotide diphosphorylase [Cyclobacteriaceae bacterium]|nr:carboxylating nicotinate-nucleotide diphosphorylase [Cyclobacteriaceae bacterium]
MNYLSEITINSFIRMALAEDVGQGDHSSLASIPAGDQSTALLKAKADGVVAGISLAERILLMVDDTLKFKSHFRDGQLITIDDLVMEISGNSQAILKAERLMLNCMQRMSGIATLTKQYVDAIQGTQASILDTRKTTPNFRPFEKWAVLIGGGQNHRYNLEDMMMLKDNHIDCAGGIKAAVDRCNTYRKEKNLDIGLEVETRDLGEVKQVLACEGVQRVMLDNMSSEEMKEAVLLIDHKIETEASGGITLENVKDAALSGVDFISIGALTHSYTSLDLSLVIKSI